MHKICIPAGAIISAAHALNLIARRLKLLLLSVSPFSRRLLIVIIASYIVIKSKQTRIKKFKKEVGIDYIYKK